MKRLVLAVALAATVSTSAPALAQAPLAVPYLPQSEALCGGAAAAMVMRFWGARGVYADAFAPLIDKAAGGIHTSALSGALVARGWRTDAGGGDLPRLAREVGLGHPVIALIEDRPGRFHYVVVVSAAADGAIVVHDPARAPSRAMDASAFDRKWQKSDRWMLVALPPPPGSDLHFLSPPPLPSTRSISGGVRKWRSDPGGGVPRAECRVDEGIALAQRGDRAGARRALEAVAARCPDDGAAWRELAGLDALDANWPSAAERARQALERDADDEQAWRVLATAEYLRHDDFAALVAWNRLGEPKVDIVNVSGLGRTRYRVVSDAIGLRPGDLLTPGAVRLAQRRVREIPALSTASISFHPLDRGDAQLDATVVERERAPLSYLSALTIAAGALVSSEVTTSFNNVSGGGDSVDVSWRWWEHRPRIGAAYAAPGPFGTWRLDAWRETQTFGRTPFEETRTHLGGEISNWLTHRVRLSGALGLDRWQGLGKTATGSSRVEIWPVTDRLAVSAGVAAWTGSNARFGTADLRVRWRSSSMTAGNVVLAEAGYQTATATAPASVWPGADTGYARGVLLRAHPLLDEGIITGGVFGRRIGFGSVEARHWLPPITHHLLRIAPAVFLDTARASHGLPATDPRIHYDLGAGLRVGLLGFGVFRMDVARGVRDGNTALSFGWER